MSKRLSDENSVWMYEDDDREDDTFTDTDLQNGLAQLITGDWGYGTEVNWENLQVQTFDNAGIDEEVRSLWLHSQGQILAGDTVEVFKGCKVPRGTIATVKSIRPYYDRYGRWVADYAYFTDGQRTNIENCRLLLKQA